MVHYDPYAYATHEDPYPIYARLREEAPVYRNEEIGFWALSRHADVLAGFKDSAGLSSAQGVSLEPSASHPQAHTTMSFLAMDPPRHDLIRGLVSRGFTPRRIADLEPRVRVLARGYLERLAEQGRCDFTADLAGRVPMDVISEMLGLPEADRTEVRAWADALVHREEGMRDVPPAGMEAGARMIAYFNDLIAEHRRTKYDDLTTALIEAELEGETLSDWDVLAFLFLMIVAGNETTTKLLGNAVYWLWRNPEERARLREDPGLIPAWIEETVRYDPSTQSLARTLTHDLELHGETMKQGDRVVLLIGSANRDQRVFADADRYDITRDTGDMVSFGHGTHFCLGAALARLEARVTLEEFFSRFADYEIEPGGISRVHSINVRGFAKLPMELRHRHP